jgi:hypothetical protein
MRGILRAMVMRGAATMAVSRRVFLGVGMGSVLFLAGCSTDFQTSFAEPIPAKVSRGWRVADVRVAAPESLTVSEARVLAPNADVVWREDPPGDRRAQVGAVVRKAAMQGARGLRGSRPVYLDVTITRFHALTFEAETRASNAGVHDIEFLAQVVDARTGAVLAGPDRIEASLPALAGTQMTAARLRGESQRSHITAHLEAVFAGWLGDGPDPRGRFQRLGV